MKLGNHSLTGNNRTIVYQVIALAAPLRSTKKLAGLSGAQSSALLYLFTQPPLRWVLPIPPLRLCGRRSRKISYKKYRCDSAPIWTLNLCLNCIAIIVAYLQYMIPFLFFRISYGGLLLCKT